jgi:hypothetical protein
MYPVFTVIAFVALAGIAWLAHRSNENERIGVATFSDEEVRQSVVFVRQDMKLVAFMR